MKVWFQQNAPKIYLIHELTKRAGLFSLSFYFFPINQTGADLYNAVSRSKMKNLKIPQSGKIRTVKLNRKKIKTSMRSKREKEEEKRAREGGSSTPIYTQ